jgi:hypothetical protein
MISGARGDIAYLHLALCALLRIIGRTLPNLNRLTFSTVGLLVAKGYVLLTSQMVLSLFLEIPLLGVGGWSGITSRDIITALIYSTQLL